MKFEASQSYDAPPEHVIAVYADPASYVGMTGLTKIAAPELVDVTTAGATVVLRMNYRFIASLPAVATAVIDQSKATWVDETAFDLDTLTATTAMLPDHYGNKIKVAITQDFVADGDGCRRVVRGDLKVKMLLVGGQVEKVIVNGLKDHLTEEQPWFAALLA